VLATGSQGERRAASAQLSTGKYMGLELKKGDLFLFSSKTIPGNEVSVGRILNALSEKGVKTVDDSSEKYHVSGHPNRPDLVTMQDLVRPKAIVPMHGEHRHLSTHAELAEERGFAAAVAPNGTMLDLTGDAPVVADHVETGRLYLDGSQMIGAMDGVVRDRIRMATRGLVTVSVIIDESGKPMGDPWVETLGLPDVARLRDGIGGALEEEIGREMGRAKKSEIADDDALEKIISRACARCCNDLIGKKPLCTVMISRLE
jgi:ribonuclease J